MAATNNLEFIWQDREIVFDAKPQLLECRRSEVAEVNALALSRNPLNPIIVSGSADGKIIVWDLFRLKVKYVLVDSVEPAMAEQHADRSWEVTSVAVADHPHPIILSSTWTSTVRVWDSKTGDLLRVLDGVHVRRVSDIRVGLDEVGPVIVTCSHDGHAVVWSPEDDLLVESREALSSLEKASELDLEQSLVIAGKYYCYWSMALQLHLPVVMVAGGTGWDAEDSDDRPSKAPEPTRSISEREISPTAAAVIFHSILRLGTINPQLVRVKAQALNFVLGKALSVVDLLEKDAFLHYSPCSSSSRTDCVCSALRNG
jgi:WD40 repeat protein